MVGNSYVKLIEDPRRIIRGVRFMAYLGLTACEELTVCFNTPEVINRLEEPVYKDWIVMEINKSFTVAPIETMKVLSKFPVISSLLFNRIKLNLLTNSKKNRL